MKEKEGESVKEGEEVKGGEEVKEQNVEQEVTEGSTQEAEPVEAAPQPDQAGAVEMAQESLEGEKATTSEQPEQP